MSLSRSCISEACKRKLKGNGALKSRKQLPRVTVHTGACMHACTHTRTHTHVPQPAPPFPAPPLSQWLPASGENAMVHTSAAVAKLPARFLSQIWWFSPFVTSCSFHTNGPVYWSRVRTSPDANARSFVVDLQVFEALFIFKKSLPSVGHVDHFHRFVFSLATRPSAAPALSSAHSASVSNFFPSFSTAFSVSFSLHFTDLIFSFDSTLCLLFYFIFFAETFLFPIRFKTISNSCYLFEHFYHSRF